MSYCLVGMYERKVESALKCLIRIFGIWFGNINNNLRLILFVWLEKWIREKWPYVWLGRIFMSFFIWIIMTLLLSPWHVFFSRISSYWRKYTMFGRVHLTGSLVGNRFLFFVSWEIFFVNVSLRKIRQWKQWPFNTKDRKKMRSNKDIKMKFHIFFLHQTCLLLSSSFYF